MSQLGQIAAAIESYNDFVTHEIARARSDSKFAAELRARWATARAAIETTSRCRSRKSRARSPNFS
jgi:hypothetical protein